MTKSRSLLFLCILFMITILICGCINSRTATVNSNIVVNHSGTIVTYKTTITLPQSSYHDFSNYIAAKKYTSVREYFLRDYGYSKAFFDVDENIGDPTVITFYNVVPISSDNTPRPISVKIQNSNQVVFNDTSYSSDYFIPKSFIKELTYSVSIPVKIDKGNYHTLSKDAYTAYWTYKNDGNSFMANNPVDIPELYVISQVANQNNVKPTESPGFGMISTFLCLVVVLLIVRRNA